MTAPPAAARPIADKKTPQPEPPPRFEVYEQIQPAGVFRWRLITADATAIVSHTEFGDPDDAAADALAVQRAAAAAAKVVRLLGPAGGLDQ